MTCEELLEVLNDYIDGGLEPGLCQEFERYMAGCNPCKVVVDNIRQTITLYRGGEPLELPLDFRAKLHEAIRARWRQAPQAPTPPHLEAESPPCNPAGDTMASSSVQPPPTGQTAPA